MNDRSLTNETSAYCECCGYFKLCKMYVIQTGKAVWICKACRTGEKHD